MTYWWVNICWPTRVTSMDSKTDELNFRALFSMHDESESTQSLCKPFYYYILHIHVLSNKLNRIRMQSSIDPQYCAHGLGRERTSVRHSRTMHNNGFCVRRFSHCKICFTFSFAAARFDIAINLIPFYSFTLWTVNTFMAAFALKYLLDMQRTYRWTHRVQQKYDQRRQYEWNLSLARHCATYGDHPQSSIKNTWFHTFD